ncbi:MAG TPA: protein-L-isoaspartate O-methyltransferase [Burkholderiales bacterium]|nr:protein-L-isoaspartate O-methyltransferase [Burkholderiales bacterium]
MSVEQARFNMIEQQIRPWDVLDQDVLDLLYAVRREEFVPPAYRDLAFSDLEIPLYEGARPCERMLQPKVEARILQELAVRKHERVLEVGAGSGYLAALLAARAQHVHSVEINPKLKAFAEGNLQRSGIDNVAVEQGDAAQGWATHAPYDVIVLTGSTPVLPQSFLLHLKVGGRLLAVVGDPPVMEARLITCVDQGVHHTIDLFETSLAPLKNAMQPGRFQF